jgi:hypothetical protein
MAIKLNPTKRMKNKNGILMAMFACAVLAVASIGCKTVVTTDANGISSTNKVPDQVAIAIATGAAKSAAYLGTKIYLEGIPPRLAGHPNDRPAFETARASVKTLIAAGTFSSGDLSSALQGLPIKELQGGKGTLIVGEAVTLWDTYGRLLASLDKAQAFQEFVLPFAQAIADGLDLALGPATAAPTTVTPTPANLEEPFQK